MAKEQKRSNREVRKPKAKKKDTTAVPVLPSRDTPPPTVNPKKKA